ncbi:MAG: TonB-dependent receptor [Caldimonas sp.]
MTGRRWCGLACVLLATASRADNPAEVLELPQVEIVGTTPLPGSGITLRKLPANAQIFTSPELREQRNGSLAEFLERNATGISINAAQGNRFQSDVNFRGFAASPLLGTPQGVSVFFDGVRVNEPFGDAVNWDLIAPSAISSIQLIPGSNPAFGLNTLGGAIAVYSKSGASEYPERPGGSIALSGGSFGRRTLTIETGGKAGPWDWFVTSNNATDRGWAEHNASLIRQLFAKVGWQDDRTDVDLSFSEANNRLAGHQTLPLSFADIRSSYTYPDENRNRAGFLALKASHALSDAVLLSGNAYARRFQNRNLSSNINDDPDAGEDAAATNDSSLIEQTSYGAGLQLAYTRAVAGMNHQAIFGATLDQGRARFTRQTQNASFTADRGTTATSPFQTTTDSDSTSRHLGLFVADSIDLDPRWTLTLSGRFNRATTSISDRSGSAPELDGSHRFSRFNPAAGLSFHPSSGLTVYTSYNEGMRAPTAIELTCADPAAPCKLPNNFLADPPLKKLVAKTVEAGARGKLGSGPSWSAAVFRTDLHDDLQFISSNGVAVNAGYFQNVGVTRRQGIELGGSGQLDRLGLSLRYSFIDATFRTAFAESSPGNSRADTNGAIVVRSGDRIPSIPRHSLKLRAELQASLAWQIGVTAQLASSVYARGDENNADSNGRVPGFALVNVDTRFRLAERLQLFARVDNAFDRRYANFAILGSNLFTGPAQGFDAAHPRREQFRGYGAPRSAEIGFEYRFE